MKKLILFVIVVGIIGAIAKLAETKKAEWSALTEGEVRDKLDAKLGDRVPADKKSKVQDVIVDKMRAHGAFRDEVATA